MFDNAIPDCMTRSKRVLYCQMQGLLARCALQARGMDEARVPLAVAEGKLVRGASLLAGKRGVQVGESLLRARRLCPELLVVPLGEVDARSLSAELWDGLAELTDQVEPSGPDAVFAKLYGVEGLELLTRRFTGMGALSGLSPKLALGCSKLEAATLALAGVECLEDAPVIWLSPDTTVVGKLARLGLTTFGAVVAVGEAALIYQFGRKVGPLLYRRAQGEDSDPVRSLWPLPVVEVARRFDLDPIEDRSCVDAHLVALARQAATELTALRRFGRVVTLEISSEREGTNSGSWRPPWPVQAPGEVLSCIRRLVALRPIRSAVTSLRLVVSELDLPAASTLSLFESTPASSLGRLESTKRWITARYGAKALTAAGKLPISLRDRRRSLAQRAGRL